MLSVDSAITFLRTADIEASSRFYSEGLGLTLVLDQGGCRIFRLNDDAYLGICERGPEVESKIVVTIVTDDVDAWHARVTEAGIETDGSPRDNDEYRIYHFYMTDPDGHTLEIQRFWDAAWKDAAEG